MLRQAQHEAGGGRDGGPSGFPGALAESQRAARALRLVSGRNSPHHTSLVEGFPSTEQLIELNRQAAAEAFSGYLPRMVLTLAATVMVAIFGVLLTIRLHELDTRLAGCVTW